MKIPFRLAPMATREPAAAVLVPGPRAADVVDLVVRLELEALPDVFATADGFLVKLPRPLESPLAGVVRLRALAENLFLPVDADLIPPLLPDEAIGLTRSRGLVFLPGLRVLEFAAEAPLTWSALLRPTNLQKPAWRDLPEPPTLADELIEVTSGTPPTVSAILESGGQGVGTEAPTLDKPMGVGTRVLGTSLFAIGHITAWLGVKLGLSGIANAGANLLQRALDRVPRLSQFLMDQQEALLRRLLKDFQDGKIEEALRRALPLSGPNSPSSMSTTASLPQHSLIYSLQNLLGGRGAGGSAWFTPDQLFYSLQAEYRKQAEAAARAGDYRRAAFIYAKLLNDLSSAAHILSQGGLHRDAAVIYDDGLNNARAAAGEWELAGEIDKALEIYDERLHDDLAAAELLRRVGETRRALDCFLRAARKLGDVGNYFEAGELMRDKAERLDLALTFFAEGWRKRPHSQAIPCGLFLAHHHAQSPDVPRFQTTVDEACECISGWSDESAVQIFNRIARLANEPNLSAVRDTTRDRCLMALATKLASRSDPRRSAALFPGDTPWSAPVVRDALFAANTTPVRPSAPHSKSLARLGRSTVRAVCHMPMFGDLFVGFENGEIIQFHPATGETRTIATLGGPILGLVTDTDEQTLVALSWDASAVGHVLIGSRATKFDLRDIFQTPAGRPARLLAMLDNQDSPFFGVIAGEDVHVFRCDNLSFRQTVVPRPGSVPYAGIIGNLPRSLESPWVLLFYEGEILVGGMSRRPVDLDPESLPENPRVSTLHQPPLACWLGEDGCTTVRWLCNQGTLMEMRVDLTNEPTLALESPCASRRRDPFPASSAVIALSMMRRRYGTRSATVHPRATPSPRFIKGTARF